MTWILDLLKKQGFSFVLLGLITWYFYGKVEALEEKLEQRQQYTVDLLTGLIEENTQALQDVCRALEKLEIKKEVPAESWRRNTTR